MDLIALTCTAAWRSARQEKMPARRQRSQLRTPIKWALVVSRPQALAD